MSLRHSLAVKTLKGKENTEHGNYAYQYDGV